eukprot:1177554-Prorocentrum_minimum.AAC.2
MSTWILIRILPLTDASQSSSLKFVSHSSEKKMMCSVKGVPQSKCIQQSVLRKDQLKQPQVANANQKGHPFPTWITDKGTLEKVWSLVTPEGQEGVRRGSGGGQEGIRRGFIDQV